MKPDFNPVIISSKEIFSEKQLREFTVNIKAVTHYFPRRLSLNDCIAHLFQATYYDDTRTGVLDGVINFVKGIFAKKEETEESDDSSPVLVKSLKPTVSIAVLEEKVNHFP